LLIGFEFFFHWTSQIYISIFRYSYFLFTMKNSFIFISIPVVTGLILIGIHILGHRHFSSKSNHLTLIDRTSFEPFLACFMTSYNAEEPWSELNTGCGKIVCLTCLNSAVSKLTNDSFSVYYSFAVYCCRI
jgi:hypothetical protein